MREMPDHFTCDACHALQHVDLLCTRTSSPRQLLCVACCLCDPHASEVEGTVVFAGAPLTWRGLDGSEARARRHR